MNESRLSDDLALDRTEPNGKEELMSLTPKNWDKGRVELRVDNGYEMVLICGV